MLPFFLKKGRRGGFFHVFKFSNFHFVLGVFEEKQSADVCLFVGQDPYLVGSLMITNSIAIQIYIYINIYIYILYT